MIAEDITSAFSLFLTVLLELEMKVPGGGEDVETSLTTDISMH
jgi:hypothetical protein